MVTLEEKLKTLPESPGVYIMYDGDGNILYIGKAKVLKNRVRQYFHMSGNKTVKLMIMTSKIVDLSYIIASSESDALALEATLIKQHRPPYNILLKDDKSRPYIKINLKAEYPVPEITRKLKSDGAKYYGPFFGVSAKEIIELIQSAYMVRTCKHKSFVKGHRECLNYHIGLCAAPCTRRISPELYRKQIDKVMSFLAGRDENLERTLTARMQRAAEEERFEAAINYRNKLDILKRMRTKLVTSLPREADMDIIGYAENPSYSVLSVLNIRAGKMSGADNYSVPNTGMGYSELVSTFMAQYYDGSKRLPEEIVLSESFGGEDAFVEWAAKVYDKPVKLTVPQRGAKVKLAENANDNAIDYLATNTDRQKVKEDMSAGAVEGLQRLLGLKRLPVRMECYDISNISGTDKVSSMVVFENGEPLKSAYRRFRIKTVEGANDFASMKETLGRRFDRLVGGDYRFGRAPDLIVIDGGKGQLKFAREAAAERGLDIEMIGLAKREEEVFTHIHGEPVRLDKSGWELKLLQRIRDEAHRFALGYHRTLREQNFRSELMNIEGVGRKRIAKLFEAFGTINRIKEAEAEELSKVEGISTTVANKIYGFFHS